MITRITVCKVDQNLRHITFKVFEDGANCGQLVMTVRGWTSFILALKAAASKSIDFEELGPVQRRGTSE